MNSFDEDDPEKYTTDNSHRKLKETLKSGEDTATNDVNADVETRRPSPI